MIEFCENCREEGRHGVRATTKDSKGRHSCEQCRLLEPLPLGDPEPKQVALEKVEPKAQQDEVASVHLVARNPQEMQLAQSGLQSWLTGKVASIKAELKDLKKAHDTAIQNKWASKTLYSQITRANQRLTFYDKTRLAVEAGYCVIPNFPIDVFAVRVTKQKPTAQIAVTTSSWGDPANNLRDTEAQVLPSGIGRYVNPSPLVRTWVNPPSRDEKGIEVTERFAKATAFDEIEFPIIAAQATIMDATANAMAIKVFDRIGICPQSRPKGDPLIIGQIISAKVGWQERKTISFIIGWHLDLRTL